MVVVTLIPMLFLAQHLQAVNVQPLFENLFYLFVFLFLFPLNSSLSLAKLLYGRFITLLLSNNGAVIDLIRSVFTAFIIKLGMVILGLLADDCQLFDLDDKVVKVLAPGSHR